MKIIIAGGGTGGHIFPALAIAGEVMRRSEDNNVLFVGSRKGIENSVVPKEGFPLHRLHIEGFKNKFTLQTLKAFLLLPGAFISSFWVIRGYKPDAILGVGGYSSGPVVLLGLWMGYKCFIQEQNIFPGKTNRFLGRRVEGIFTSFPQTEKCFFPKKVEKAEKNEKVKKVFCVGNPVRKEIRSLPEKESIDMPGLKKERFTVLVFGGSLGAHKINTAVVDALEIMGDIRDKIQFIHQTGEKDKTWVEKEYKKTNFFAVVTTFIEKMEEAYAYADMIICRSGAGTITELAYCKKPALLIPYPFAAENHQEKNAEILSDTGAAFMLLDGMAEGGAVAKIIRQIYFCPKQAKKMSCQMSRFFHGDAASRIIDFIYESIKKRRES